MKAGIIFTGTGPIAVLTSCNAFDDPQFLEQMRIKGIYKFIAYEVPIDLLKEKYGQHYSVTVGDRRQTDRLRVLDWEGHRVLYNFPMDTLSEPVFHEEEIPEYRKAA